MKITSNLILAIIALYLGACATASQQGAAYSSGGLTPGGRAIVQNLVSTGVNMGMSAMRGQDGWTSNSIYGLNTIPNQMVREFMPVNSQSRYGQPQGYGVQYQPVQQRQYAPQYMSNQPQRQYYSQGHGEGSDYSQPLRAYPVEGAYHWSFSFCHSFAPSVS